jgi:hypothetical protein
MSVHQWQFFRSGGFDQVRLDRISDWQNLDSLDQKLWAALACPTRGLELDARTLAYLDADGDQRVRVPEVLAAVRWALSVLKEPEVLLHGEELPLGAIDNQTEEGARLLVSARGILANLDLPGDALRVADTADLTALFPPHRPNGDGIVPAALATEPQVKQLIEDILATLGGATDRSGEAGVTQAGLDTFVQETETYVAWAEEASPELAPFGEDTAAFAAALAPMRAKIDDYFVRCDLASYDARAEAALNGSDADLAALGAQLLDGGSAASAALPLARIEGGRALPLGAGVNPAWQAGLTALIPALSALSGEEDSLDQATWSRFKAALEPFVCWQAAEPVTAVTALGLDRLKKLLAEPSVPALAALIAEDIEHAQAAAEMVSVDKLVRYQRYLRVLLNNFVNFRDFFARKGKAVFQNGTLYLDGRTFDLVVRVQDAAKHAALAGLSRAYLLYCDCARPGTQEKITVVAAVTAGHSGTLMVGRNGIYYDCAGQDWDATITRMVTNPISVAEAFYSPYRRLAQMLSEQAQKLAATKDKTAHDQTLAGVSHTTGGLLPPAKPAPPAPFDVARFAGIFAAIGLAVGAIGTALAAVVTGLLKLSWWQMPLAFLGAVLSISGPSMVMAWFKLRQRNLGPILDANGWAVNTMARINIPFGTALTSLAVLPPGAERALVDPYADERSRWPWVLLALGVLGAFWVGYRRGWF